jgi:DNA-binding transcriptional LysR family regulator
MVVFFRSGATGRPCPAGGFREAQSTALTAHGNLIVTRVTLHDVKLSTFDLNHARALHFLLEEAHVARAARHLGITPAAASNALRRLRTELGDPLLVPVGRALARTPLAEELRGPAREVIAAAERLVDVVVPFDAATYDGVFVLGTADRIAEVLLRPIDALLSERAPHARLNLRTLGGPLPSSRPEPRGLYIFPAGVHHLDAEPLFIEPFVCVLRAGHPLLRGRFTLQRYAAADHVLVAPKGESDRGIVDDILAEHGLTRRVSRVVASFSLALTLVQGSDRIATLPGSVTALRPPVHALVFRPPPVAIPPNQMQLAWHPQQDRDPRYLWFRRLIHDAVGAIGLGAIAGSK